MEPFSLPFLSFISNIHWFRQQWERKEWEKNRRSAANRSIVPYWMKWVYWQQPNINYNNNYTGTLVHKQTGLFYRFAICVFKRNSLHWRRSFSGRIWKKRKKIFAFTYSVNGTQIQFEWGNCIVERWTSKSIYSYLSEHWTLNTEHWNERILDVQHKYTQPTK